MIDHRTVLHTSVHAINYTCCNFLHHSCNWPGSREIINCFVKRRGTKCPARTYNTEVMDYGGNSPIHGVLNPHQRKIEGNVKAQRLSDAGLEINAKGDSEPDPELLEQFDSFYKTTKSLLVLFQIMGVMPIERSGKGKTTFRYGSNLRSRIHFRNFIIKNYEKRLQ